MVGGDKLAMIDASIVILEVQVNSWLRLVRKSWRLAFFPMKVPTLVSPFSNVLALSL